jgi:hypothetical protein
MSKRIDSAEREAMEGLREIIVEALASGADVAEFDPDGEEAADGARTFTVDMSAPGVCYIGCEVAIRLRRPVKVSARAVACVAACAGVEDPADLRRLAEVVITGEAIEEEWINAVVDSDEESDAAARLELVLAEKAAILARLDPAGFGTVPEASA